jgi:hypothetical protein
MARLRNQLQAQHVDLFKDVNAVVDLNLGGRHMSKRKLTKQELKKQRGEELPEREVMSTLNPPMQTMPPTVADDFNLPADSLGVDDPPTGGTS